MLDGEFENTETFDECKGTWTDVTNYDFQRKARRKGEQRRHKQPAHKFVTPTVSPLLGPSGRAQRVRCTVHRPLPAFSKPTLASLSVHAPHLREDEGAAQQVVNELLREQMAELRERHRVQPIAVGGKERRG